MSRPSAPLDPSADDPLNPKVSTSCLDFLLIELVPLAQRVAEQLQAREQVLLEEYKRSRIFNRTASKTPARTDDESKADGSDAATAPAVSGGTDAEITVTTLGFTSMTPQTRQDVFHRLDSLGYRVGQGLVER